MISHIFNQSLTLSDLLLLCSYWSMPQGAHKSEPERIEFEVMLPNINLLYLFCDVLILLDLTYMGRFWYVSPDRCSNTLDGMLTM